MTASLWGLAILLGAPVLGASAPAVSTSVQAPVASPALTTEAGPLPTPQFRRYTVVDGLPSTAVYAVAQDKHGNMWFGTKSGVARFDGVHFQVFRHTENDQRSLYNNSISTLLVDTQGQLWAGGLDAGVNRFDERSGTFQHWGHVAGDAHSLASDRVWVIAQAPSGTIWVGTSAGVDRMLPGGKGFEHVINPLLGPHPEDVGTVGAIYADTRGVVWVGSDRGVFRFNTDGTIQRIRALDPAQSMDAWRIDGDGDEVRIATGRGLLIAGADGIARPFGASVIPRTNVMSSTRDAGGRLWIGTQRGMFLQAQRGGPVTAVNNQPLLTGDLPGSWVWQTLADREGGLWVTLLDGGVAYLAPGWNSFSRFTHIPDDEASLRDSVATTMARGHDGRHVWVGEREGRVDRLDPVTGEVEHMLSGLHGDVAGMTEDDRQRLWVVVQGALFRYDFAHSQLVQIDPQAKLLKHPLEVEPGPDGLMYARTFGQGVLRIDPETLAVSRVAMDQPNEKVLWGSQMMLRDGTFWYASDGGLLRLDRVHDRFAVVPGAPTADSVDAFAFAKDGIWMANVNGLSHYRYQGDGFVLDRTVDAVRGWPSLNVVDLNVDGQGRVWIFGHDGLWRFDPDENEFRAIGLQDGLSDGEFARGYAQMPSGYIYGATLGGVVAFDPDKPETQSGTPTLAITQVTVKRNGVEQSLPLDQPDVEVGWRDSQLQVQARLFSYVDPWSNRYRFRMNGFDTDWVDRDNHGEREFTGLGSGDYTLDIMASGANGAWINLAQPLHIHVQAPPWQRWWAWLIYISIVALIAWLLLLSWRRRLAHRHRMQLAEQRRQIAEQASAAKSQFLATLSHEIRTPMTGVMGMAELLLSTPLDEIQREYAQAMQQSGDVLLKLLNDALDMARIEAGKLIIDPAPFDPRILVADVLRLQKSAAQEKDLPLRATVDDNVPVSLIGDALRVRQVLFNLVNNAVKFTERGEVTIHAGWHDDQLQLDVSDTGPGIPSGSRERLFRRFEQDESPQRGAGSGLGLAICSELVALMNGSLTLESEVGQGSTFSVRVPLRVSPDVVRPRPMPVDIPVDCSLDLLLVESDAHSATAIRGILEQHGHRVRWASNGLEALTELEQQSCHAILLDLDLPGLDGFQVAHLIRQRETAGEHIPIIAITTRTTLDEDARGRQVGIDSFLRKPLTGAQLAATLAAVLSAQSVSHGAAHPA